MSIIKNDMGEKPYPDKAKHKDIVWARIDSIVSLILENERYLQSKRNVELTNIVMERFGVRDRMARQYISEAKREIRRIGVADKKKAMVKALRDREYLLQKAKGIKDAKGHYIDKPDHKLALEIMKDRDKLAGLYVDEVKNTGEVTIKNIDMSKFTDYGLERLKRGDKVEAVLMDPKAVKVDNV